MLHAIPSNKKNKSACRSRTGLATGAVVGLALVAAIVVAVTGGFAGDGQYAASNGSRRLASGCTVRVGREPWGAHCVGADEARCNIYSAFCEWASSGPGPNPTAPAPTPTTPAPTPKVTATEAPATEAPAPGPTPACVATELGKQNWLNDAQCAQCGEGYQYWPCDREGWCECTDPAPVDPVTPKPTPAPTPKVTAAPVTPAPTPATPAPTTPTTTTCSSQAGDAACSGHGRHSCTNNGRFSFCNCACFEGWSGSKCNACSGVVEPTTPAPTPVPTPAPTPQPTPEQTPFSGDVVVLSANPEQGCTTPVGTWSSCRNHATGGNGIQRGSMDKQTLTCRGACPSDISPGGTVLPAGDRHDFWTKNPWDGRTSQIGLFDIGPEGSPTCRIERGCGVSATPQPAGDKIKVVFRLDDVQSFWSTITQAQTKLLDVFAASGVKLNAGIVADARFTAGTGAVGSALKAKLAGGGLELFNHGADGATALEGKSESAMNTLVANTQSYIRSTFGVTPAAFVPHQNKWDNNLVKALVSNGMSVLSTSAARGGSCGVSGGLMRAKAGASTMWSPSVGLTAQGASTVYAEIKAQARECGFAVVMMHPQEYAMQNGATNTASFARLQTLLDLVKADSSLESGFFSELKLA